METTKEKTIKYLTALLGFLILGFAGYGVYTFIFNIIGWLS